MNLAFRITPISSKWREAIVKRIEEGRRQTMVAAGRGAKLDPGQYWSLSGTFLFTVYVMTALGFGAPVPQTVYGRCLSLLYAVFAVPTHVYLNSPSSSNNSDVKTRRRKFCGLMSVLTWGHCVPLTSAVYYAAGVLIFGLVRQTEPIDILLFPLQFTTGGGLASVEWYFRLLYGFYVEGAMMVLACAVATLRRYSGNSVNNMTVKYRLFARDKCGK
ncbi:hypothetical protein MSG28_009279 [Choristoneura fumiferana]|uniref:Uncharacterized protein n=1 Tax=Choristoneura fumiferana TaxID=7141 RepID=A0ACC0KXV0_CHOFU|nr:hypothetical protein MSG28_009279 [Choristoneura fumiferana]